MENDNIEESTYSRIFEFNDNQVTITQFNKAINKDKKNKKLDELLLQFETFFEKNRDTLQFEDSVRLVNNFLKIFNYCKTKENIIDFINSHLSSYIEFDSVGFIQQRTTLYTNYSIEYALSFIETKNHYNSQNENLPIAFINNPLVFINSIIYQSELLFLLKKYDESFSNYGRISKLLPNLEYYNYLSITITVHKNKAEICFHEASESVSGKGLYNYLFYELSSFIFEILKDISGFPIWNPFLYRKSIKYCWLNDNSNFDFFLNKLRHFDLKDKIIEDVTFFTYNTLPLIYGIPEKYLIEDTNGEWTDMEEYTKQFFFFQNRETLDIINLIPEIVDFINKLELKYFNQK